MLIPPSRVLCVFFGAAALVCPAHALAWDAFGHRLITRLAVESLRSAPASTTDPMPAWLLEDASLLMLEYQCSEADRYRGVRAPVMGHENSPEHFLDAELLDQYGLTLASLPPLRYRYVTAMSVARHVHPERVKPYDESADADGGQEWPGFLPYAIMEHHTKLRASMRQYRILERLGERASAAQRDMARSNILYHAGMLSHFVGDAAQPLHLTEHFNGFVGPNPNNYTTATTFHAYIDGGVLAHHAISADTVRTHPAFAVPLPALDPNDPWPQTLVYLQATFDLVIPLYELEKSGELNAAPGDDFIRGRLAVASRTLAAYYAAAWAASAVTERDVEMFLRYDAAAAPPARSPPPPAPAPAANTENPSP